MKKLFFLLLLAALTTGIAKAQDFEGEVLYSIKYQSKNPKMSNTQMEFLFGNWQSFGIKGGSYKNTSNGKVLLWQIYKGSENKLYNKAANAETIFWIDVAVQKDEVLKTELNKGVTEILGYKCDELILTCKSGLQKYYFNAELAINPETYKTHKYGNWYDYLLLSKAIPLKTIIENEQFVMEQVATAVKPKKVAEDYFNLPINAETAPSPN